MRSAWWRAAVGAAVAVAVVVGAVTLLGRGTSSTAPSVLHLAGTAGARAEVRAGGDPRGYELVGTLPSAHPDTPAWSLRPVADHDAVRRLTTALRATSPVRVSAEGSWWWSRCADGAVSSDGATSGCAVAQSGTVVPGSAGGGTATGAPAPTRAATPSTETVRRVAAPLLAALGLDVADAEVQGSSAVVDPVVGGLPSYGLTTRVTVTGDATVADAAGWLVRPARADTYPVRPAEDVFDALPPLPRPMMACPESRDGRTQCPGLGPVQVTGARLGLAVQPLVGGGHVLVPAWLFAVKGSTEPVVGLAVAQKFLGTPATSSPREPFSFDQASRTADPDAVSVRYGDSSSCPHEDVTASVKESADAVVVLLEAESRPRGVACTDDYRPVDRVVRLQAPLGDRRVVDGASGRTVPLS